jgi:ABC-type uncharacterized transport system ATPase subunit
MTDYLSSILYPQVSDKSSGSQRLAGTYRVPVRNEGFGAAIKSLIHREYHEITAVPDVSFEIEPG